MYVVHIVSLKSTLEKTFEAHLYSTLHHVGNYLMSNVKGYMTLYYI